PGCRFAAVQAHDLRAGGRLGASHWFTCTELCHMTPESIMTMGQQALLTALLVSAPLLLAALAIGLVVSVFQAMTQINEMTLSFRPEVGGVSAVAARAGPGMVMTLADYGRGLFQGIPGIVG